MPAATKTEAKPARVLVVGEDSSVVELLCTTLRFVDYQVRTASSGADAVAVADRWKPNLVIRDGFEITQFHHGKRHSVPAIFLTPGKELQSAVLGVTVGGGDYLTKPFSPEGLLARVRTMLRRANSSASKRSNDGILSFADLEMNEDTHEVRRAGQLIQLSPREFALLRYLIRNPDTVLTRTQILDHVWPYGYDGDPKVVETYMYRIRRKVNRTEPPLIETLRGNGYILRVPAT
ncbi:two-component system OmpR family response regulator [Pseudonocardia eucalypti]|nr:two-component system OmpR family response regulator [Pseudonocardia eucalypti]